MPDERAAVEYWRVRTVNRFIVWVGLSAFALLAGGGLVGHIATFARVSIERYGGGFGILSLAVFGFILVYYAAQVGRTLFDYGNGRRPTGIELAVAVGGVTAALIGMAIMPNLDLTKP